MRIGIDARTLFAPKTGDRTYALNLARALPQLDQNNEYLLLTRRIPPNQPILPFPVPSNCQVVELHGASDWGFTMSALPRFVKRERLDVLHVQYITPFTKSCKLITTVHDVSWKRLPQSFPRKDRWLLNLFLPHALRLADMVITDSEASKIDLLKFFNLRDNKIATIPLAAEDRFFEKPSIATCQAIWKQLHITPPYLLYLGVLQPRKNLERLIKATAILKARGGLHRKLVIVGKHGWGHKLLDELTVRLGLKDDVQFVGYAPDNALPAIYQGADAFIYPSLWEGFGLPVLEAMALGIPVITSDCGSLSEIASDAAMLINPYDVNALANTIECVTTNSDLRRQLRAKGKERARQFRWTNTARETLRVYEKVVARQAK